MPMSHVNNYFYPSCCAPNVACQDPHLTQDKVFTGNPAWMTMYPKNTNLNPYFFHIVKQHRH